MKARRTVVFLNRFYWPEHAATAQMLTDLTGDLAAAGWDVRVITSRRRYSSADQLPGEDRHAGVRITRTRVTNAGHSRMLGRVLDYVTYALGAFLAVLRVPRGSIIVGMTDPPLLGALALIGARLRGGRAVYWVQDLFPDIAVALGVLSERGAPHRIAGIVARYLYRRCDLVVALGPAMAAALMKRGASRDRIAIVHNWADASAIKPIAPAANDFLAEQGLGARHVILYSGNAGRAHTFDALCESMRRLRTRDDIVFLFIGGGPRIAEIEAAVARHALTNVRFLPYFPRERLDQSLSAATISIVTEDPRVSGLLVPSKTYGILASGRPLVFIGSETSDVALLVREIGCGEVVDPRDPAALTDVIARLCDDAARREEMGARARAAAVHRYGREQSTAAWDELLSNLAADAAVLTRPLPSPTPPVP